MTAEVRRTVHVAAGDGLHARPCARIADLARRSRSAVSVEHAGDVADARSILEVLTLAVPGGCEVVVTAVGPDAESIADRIAAVITDPSSV